MRFATAINCLDGRVEVSVNKQGSKLMAIVGHYDCAGNPVEEEEQLK